MTNEEQERLNKRMALEVMGWHKKTYANSNGKELSVWASDDSGFVLLVYGFNPYFNREQAMMCLEKYCDEKEADYEILSESNGYMKRTYDVRIEFNIKKFVSFHLQDVLSQAIVRAIDAALGKSE